MIKEIFLAALVRLFVCVQVGVSIQMSSFNLTRIVTMSPFYTLVNKTSYELEVGEVTSQTSTRWHYIATTEVNMDPVHRQSASDNYNSQRALQ